MAKQEVVQLLCKEEESKDVVENHIFVHFCFVIEQKLLFAFKSRILNT